MTDKEYDQKKRECWEDFCKEKMLSTRSTVRGAYFGAFDRAYALGKQEKDAEGTVISGWVARDGSGPNDLGLHVYSVKPDRMKNRREWNGHGEMSYLIDCRLFPDLTWDDDPIEVELIIKIKKNGRRTN